MSRLYSNPVYKSSDGSFHTTELAAIQHDLMESLRAELSHVDALACIQAIRDNIHLIEEYIQALKPKNG